MHARLLPQPTVYDERLTSLVLAGRSKKPYSAEVYPCPPPSMASRLPSGTHRACRSRAGLATIGPTVMQARIDGR